MTAAARDALEDCRGALTDLVEGVQGRVWRRRWIVCIVLLRAIGHVLDKVDGPRSPAYRRAIDEWWSAIKEDRPRPLIFWEFIDEERNAVIKEYQTRAAQGVTVPGAVVEIIVSTGEQRADPPLPPIYHYTMTSGPFKGRDQRELIAEAIAWWEVQLDAIDRAVSLA